jgi:hypothetical protein
MNDVLNLIRRYKCVKEMQWEGICEHTKVKVVIDINRVLKGSEVNTIILLLKK